MHTSWNYSDTGRDMSVDMSFFLSVHFRDTLRLLHINTIHIVLRRVSVSFFAYITKYMQTVLKK